MSGLKRGKFSKIEDDTIRRKFGNISLEKLAKEINRSPATVEKRAEKLGVANNTGTRSLHAEYNIKKKPYWPNLKEQFTDRELDLFIYHFGKIIEQFNHDVTHTEEMQVIEIVKIEILMDRILTQQKKSNARKNEIEERLEHETSLPEEHQDRTLIMNLSDQLASLMAAQESFTRSYRDMFDKKDKMFNMIKGTRAQRVKHLENQKESLTSWLKVLYENPDKMNRVGKKMEKMRRATEKEKERLAEYNEYMDGTVDQPLLTPETVKD